MIDGLIQCSYNLIIAARIHHVSTVDIYKLPKSIINSFAIKYFSLAEKEFIYACDAYNDTLRFRLENPHYNIINFSTGKEIAIKIYDSSSKANMMTFQINDLSKFIGLYRRYRTPATVEEVITKLFKSN